MLFVELTYTDNSDLLRYKQSPLYHIFKEFIFVKIGYS